MPYDVKMNKNMKTICKTDWKLETKNNYPHSCRAQEKQVVIVMCIMCNE